MYRLSLVCLCLCAICAGFVSAQKPSVRSSKSPQERRVAEKDPFVAYKKRLATHRDKEIARAKQLREKRLEKLRARAPKDVAKQEQKIQAWYRGLVDKSERNYVDKLARFDRRHGGPVAGDN